MMATLNVTLADLEAALARQNAEAVRALRAAAADVGWDGFADDFLGMLRAIREAGATEGADMTCEAVMSLVRQQQKAWVDLRAEANTDEVRRQACGAAMASLLRMSEDIEKIQRPPTWQDIPNDSGLWWFAWPDGEMSLVWKTHTGVITTLWGKRIGDHDNGQWSRAVVPVSPFGRAANGEGR